MAAADFFSEAFVRQVVRQLTAPGEGVLDGDRVLICDRDRKWSLRFVSCSRRLRVTRDRSVLQLQCACGAFVKKECVDG